MKNTLRHIFVFLLAMIAQAALWGTAHAGGYAVHSLSLGDGLSHPTVRCVLRDSRGALWMGTRGGLNRWWCGRMSLYAASATDKATLPDNDVLQLFEDAEGTVWAVCSRGVARYDFRADCFRRAEIEGHPLRARGYLLRPDGVVLAGAGQLVKWVYGTGEFITLPTHGGSQRYYTAIYPWTRDHYLLATRWDGLWDYNARTGDVEPFEGYAGRNIMAGIVDAEGCLWLSDYGRGICRIDRSGNLSAVDIPQLNDNGIVLDMMEKDGHLWIATDGRGLIDYNPVDGQAVGVENGRGALASVNCLHRDAYGYVYAGTVRDGVACMHSTPLTTVKSDLWHGSMTVSSILADGERMWIAVDGHGLALFEQGVYPKVTPMDATAGMKIVSIARLDNERLMLSTFDNGLCVFDTRLRRLTPTPRWAQEINSDNEAKALPIDLIQIGSNGLAVLTDNIYLWDGDSQDVRLISGGQPRARLRAFYTDMHNLLCFNERELMSLDIATGRISRLLNLKSDIIECAAYDSNRYIYIGTAEGVTVYDYDSGETSALDLPLPPHPMVTALVAGDRNLWIGAANSLWAMELSSGRLRGFGPTDGIEPNEFIYKASLLTPTHLYMGGVNGLAQVDLEGVENYVAARRELQPALVEVRADGRPVAVDGALADLPGNVATLTLGLAGGSAHPMTRTPMRLFVGDPDHATPIEGPGGSFSLGSLPGNGGRYDLWASTLDANGSWSEPTHAGTIVIAVPWWKQTAAIVIGIALLLLAMTAAGLYLRQRHKRRRDADTNEHKRKSLEKEVGFLLNLNYELRTPLTLIYSRLLMLSERLQHSEVPREKVLEELDNIKRSSGKMRDIINTTVDMWRADEPEKVDGEIQEAQRLVGLMEESTPHGASKGTHPISPSPMPSHSPATDEPVVDDAEAGEFDLTHLKAVVVEDDPELLAFMAANLAHMFGKVLEASNGNDALTLIKNSNPDIIITEARLPGMSGIELVNRLKSGRQHSHIPVIMLTTRLEEMSIANGNNYGADNYVTKPFDIGLLEKRCLSVLKSFDRVKQWYKSQAPTLLPPGKRHSNDAETFLLSVREVIEKNISQPGFGVDQIVEHLLVSRSTLYSRFKELTGQSLGNYINDYKLGRAKEMLLTTDMTMNEIADALGFNTQRYFSTFFKEKTGMTPTAFRSEARTEESAHTTNPNNEPDDGR